MLQNEHHDLVTDGGPDYDDGTDISAQRSNPEGTDVQRDNSGDEEEEIGEYLQVQV
jgi:hypothetical protein